MRKAGGNTSQLQGYFSRALFVSWVLVRPGRSEFTMEKGIINR